MRVRLDFRFWPLVSCTRCYEWDRWDLLLPLLRVEVDRAWIDDKQYNPLNWLPVILWRHHHQVWIRRWGFRLDRLVVDWHVGKAYWCSRTLGERARELLSWRGRP